MNTDQPPVNHQAGVSLPASATAGCQRWKSRRTSYRPLQEPIAPAEFGVEPIQQHVAKSFVVEHHYSGSFPYSIQSFGLFRTTSPFSKSRLVGVATFATPSNPASMDRWCGLPSEAGAELGRFVLLDEVGGNGETWFLARAFRGFKAMRPEIQCVLSYSDPHPRRSISGEVIFPGHRGAIYTTAGLAYCGRASPKTLFLASDGRVIANRILSKVRNGERGWRYAEQLLKDLTGLRKGDGESSRLFVDRVLQACRRERHAGNHLFLFPLARDRRERAALLRMPKIKHWMERVLPAPSHVDLAA